MNSENNIPDDFDNLEKYAPTLSSIDRVNCFMVPADYFSELPEAIQGNITLSSISEHQFEVPANYFEGLPGEIELGIKTAAFPKGNPFEVPVNYFDHLPSVIQDKINALKNKLPWYELLLQQLSKPKLALAYASVAILLIIGIKIINTQSIAPDHQTAQIITEEQTVNIIDESALEETLTEEELFSDASTQMSENTKPTDPIVSYLMDNQVDIDVLISELKNNENEKVSN